MESARATEMPPRKPPQVRTGTRAGLNRSDLRSNQTGRPTDTSRASRTVTIPRSPARRYEPVSVEDLIDELPEQVEVLGRGPGHSEASSLIADQETRHNHRDRARDVNRISQCRTAPHQC